MNILFPTITVPQTSSPNYPNPTPEVSRQFSGAKIKNICRISKGTLLSLQNLRPGSGQRIRPPQNGSRLWTTLPYEQETSTKWQRFVDGTAKSAAGVHKMPAVCGRNCKKHSMHPHTERILWMQQQPTYKRLWTRK